MAVPVPLTSSAPTPETRTSPDPALIVKQVVVVAAPTAQPRPPGFLARNRTTILFVLFLILGDFGVGLLAPLWDRYSPDEYTTRIGGCAVRPRDVVFVGGSPVAEGIDPSVIAGINWRGHSLTSAYAVGLHGGTTTDVYHATKLACPTPPRLIVYGLTATDLNDGRNEPHGTRDLLGPADVIEVARTRPEVGEWTARHYLEEKVNKAANIYRYRHGIRMWAATQADAIFPGSCPDTIREADKLRTHAADLARGTGYAPLELYTHINYAQLKATNVAPPPFNYLDHFHTGSHVKYLHKFADWCTANNIELILVDMPTTADLEVKYAAEFAEYRERLAEVERARGLRVLWQTRVSAGLTDEHFGDLIHMRQEGCRQFSLWLRKQLEDAGR